MNQSINDSGYKENKSAALNTKQQSKTRDKTREDQEKTSA